MKAIDAEAYNNLQNFYAAIDVDVNFVNVSASSIDRLYHIASAINLITITKAPILLANFAQEKERSHLLSANEIVDVILR